MYCAFWIDPEAPNPAKRVVVCVVGEERFVDSPTTAWAILRAAIRSEKAGGILSGPDGDLKACVDAIELEDQHWPADPHMIVARITALSQRLGCTVIFRQNLKPESAAAWAVLDACGLACGPLTGDAQRGFQTVAVGSPEAVNAAQQALYGRAACSRPMPSRLVVRFPRSRSVEAKSAKSESDFGASFEIKLPLQKSQDILDDLFGVVGAYVLNGYRFALLVRGPMSSTLFLGSKVAGSIQQAIQQYGNHLRGREASDDEPDSVDLPQTSNCRYWRFGH